MELFDRIENVTDTESFTSFLDALSQDFKDNHDDWQNQSIDDYLMSIASWIEDWENSHDNDEFEHIGFKELAKIFYVGKIYE
jgi:hypothetical protein